jgi:integrase
VARGESARRAIVAKLDGRDPRGLVPSDDPTLAQLLAQFDQERPRHDRWQIGRIVATEIPSPDGPRRFGDWRASLITSDTLKRFRQLRPAVQGNRDLSLLRAAFNWAVPLGLLPSTPFKVGGVPVVKLTREEPRSRRLQPGEAERLELNANSLLDLITAALETGCRKGELLGVTDSLFPSWRDLPTVSQDQGQAGSACADLAAPARGPRSATERSGGQGTAV